MADAKEEEREIFKIQCRILGVICLFLTFLLFACSITATVFHQELSGYPVYITGFCLAIPTALWDLFLAVQYFVLSKQKRNGKPTELCKILVGTYMRGYLFYGAFVIAGTVVMGTAIRKFQHIDIDNRVYAVAIASLAGSGISVAITIIGIGFIGKQVEPLYGIKQNHNKNSLLITFKRLKVLFVVLGIHQFVWAILAVALPAFDIGGDSLRIAGAIVGGFLTSALAFSSAAVCFRVVRLVTEKKKAWQTKTKATVAVHRPWAFVLIAICIAGVALYGNNFKTYIQSEETGISFTVPDYVIAYLIFILIGNVLVGLLQFGIVVLENEVNLLCPNAPAPKPASSNNSNTNSSNNKSAKGNAAPAAATGGAAATGTGSATKKDTPKKEDTKKTSGASLRTAEEPKIEDIKERNRLLQEQIELQKQLNELQNQQPHPVPPGSALYIPASGQIGFQPLLNLPPGYDGNADHPPGYVENEEPNAPPPAYTNVTSCPEKR
ncbi:hypothetical protein ACF0H5_024420 [Mactra antiquata]